MEGKFYYYKPASVQSHINHHQEEFGKSYENETEAFKVFIDTKKLIDEHNQKYRHGESNFKQSVNMFADISKLEKQKLAAGFRSVAGAIQGRSVSILSPGMFPPAPDSFNWTQKGFVSPVKDQGFFCSCCWAFSAIAGLESHLAIKRNQTIILSEQNLIDCNRNNATGSYGCTGGSQSSAFEYIKKMGIEPLSTYPYLEDIPHQDIYPCHFNSSNSIGKIKGYLRIRSKNETFLKEVVAHVGPVIFALNGEIDSFMYYQSGIYDDDNCKAGLSHSALIVGYGTARGFDGKPIDYWLAKNSWSTEWGENGYFRIIR